MIRLVLLAFALGLATLPARADEPSGISTTVLQRAVTDNTGAPLRYPKGKPEITTMLIELAPGAVTPPHRHPYPLAAYVLEGEIEIRADGGKVNRYKAGDAFVEALDRTHQGRNVGTGPVRILVTVVGVAGKPYIVPAPK